MACIHLVLSDCQTSGPGPIAAGTGLARGRNRRRRRQTAAAAAELDAAGRRELERGRSPRLGDRPHEARRPPVAGPRPSEIRTYDRRPPDMGIAPPAADSREDCRIATTLGGGGWGGWVGGWVSVCLCLRAIVFSHGGACIIHTWYHRITCPMIATCICSEKTCCRPGRYGW